MSKIAELLKIAEQKKDTQPTLGDNLLPILDQTIGAIHTKTSGKEKIDYDGVSVSKGNEVQVSLTTSSDTDNETSISKGNEEQVSVAKGNEVQVGRSKGNQDKFDANKKKSLENNALNNTVEISPSKDFTKVSNSIMKRAIPEKYFRGLSKHTYDVLYQRTRGAIIPTRTIQLTKDELVKLTGLSKDAIKLHIKYLKETGLLESRPAIGSHSGWEYEIFVPEEIKETVQVGVEQGKARQGKASVNLPLHSEQILHLLTPTNLHENKGTYEILKTSLKTNTKNDDDARVSEAFSVLEKRFDAAVEKLTGKGVSKHEAEKWGTLAELLILEMEAAASRTDSISSAPAFLTEVLRRKLLGGNSTAAVKTPRTKPDTVGKPNEAGEYEKRPLDKQEREAALLELRDFAGEDFLTDFKKWYTEEDWNWLTAELDKIKQAQK